MPAKKSASAPGSKRRKEAAGVEKAFGKQVRRAAERSGRKPAVWKDAEQALTRQAARHAAPVEAEGATTEVTVARTIEATASDVFRAFNDPTRRTWCFTAAFRVLSVTAPRALRFVMPDGTLVLVAIERKGNVRSAVTVRHQRLPDAAAGDGARAAWRDALTRLSEVLAE